MRQQGAVQSTTTRTLTERYVSNGQLHASDNTPGHVPSSTKGSCVLDAHLVSGCGNPMGFRADTVLVQTVVPDSTSRVDGDQAMPLAPANYGSCHAWQDTHQSKANYGQSEAQEAFLSHALPAQTNSSRHGALPQLSGQALPSERVLNR